MHIRDPGDPICRSDYLEDLKRVRRFKKFITQEERRSFPFLFEEEDDDHIVKQQNEEIKKIFDSKDE